MCFSLVLLSLLSSYRLVAELLAPVLQFVFRICILTNIIEYFIDSSIKEVSKPMKFKHGVKLIE